MQTQNGAGLLTARSGSGRDHQVLGKRHADESNLGLNDSERFIAKRLHLLSIGNSEPNGHSNYRNPPTKAPGDTTPNGKPHAPKTEQRAVQQDDLMHVDDTRDRLYIHDLDEELADIKTDEEKLIFLPDIEKKLSRIPQQILQGGRNRDHENQELVLYGVPKSLTVDEGQDSVRKAIIEARQRAQEKAIEDARHEDMNRKYDHSEHSSATETAHGYIGGYAEERDPDAMEIG